MSFFAVRTDLFPYAAQGDRDLCNGAPGSHFADWIRERMLLLGYVCHTPMQEDYGWGFWVTVPKERVTIWISVGFTGYQEGATWMVGVTHLFFPLNLVQILLRKRGKCHVDTIVNRLEGIIKEDSAMSLVQSTE